jgi:hypothetical protein
MAWNWLSQIRLKLISGIRYKKSHFSYWVVKEKEIFELFIFLTTFVKLKFPCLVSTA